MTGLSNGSRNLPLALLLCAVVILYYVGLAVYRLFFHPLSKFPGPRLAAISRWYEAYYDVIKGGKYIFKIREMHRRYGPIVRISPHELHIHDPDFYEKLYRQDGRWDKYTFSTTPLGAPGSAFTTVNHERHRMRRAATNPFFSRQKILSLEPVIQGQIEKLSKRIEEFAASGEVLVIGIAYAALTIDVVTEYAMEKSFGSLDRKDFNRDMVQCISGLGLIWRTGKHITWLPPFLERAPSWLMKKLNPKIGQWLAFRENCQSQVRRAISAEASAAIQEKSHKTIAYELFQAKNLPDFEKTEARLSDEVQTIVGAGMETSAHTLRVITFHLCSNPTMLQRLRDELRDRQVDFNSATKLQQLEPLPFLTAVIMEGLRLSYGTATRLARIAPDRVIEYGDWNIPPGTPVGMSNALIFQDESIYPDPLVFEPERWTDPAERKRLDKYFVPFSKGTRSCLGFNLAWAELYLTIATIFTRFDFELFETTIEDIELGSDILAPGTKSRNNVRVTVRKTKFEI